MVVEEGGDLTFQGRGWGYKNRTSANKGGGGDPNFGHFVGIIE